MKQVIVLLIGLFFTLNSNVVDAQQEFRSSRDFTWQIQLRPNMTFTGYWFFWSNGSAPITLNSQLENPTDWVSSITLENATTSSCSEIGTLKFEIVAPNDPGIYSARIMDLNSNFDPIEVTLLVSDILIPIDSINLTGIVNQEIVVPEPRLNDGKSNLGCVEPFYPGLSESYEFFWHADGIPGTIATSPSEFTLLNDEQIILQNSATFSQAGNFTAYRYGKVEYSNSLWVLKVNFSISETPAGINTTAPTKNAIAFPNPAENFVTIPSDASISLYSIDGKFIRDITTNTNQSQTQIDLSDLKAGIYIAKAGLNNYRIIKK